MPRNSIDLTGLKFSRWTVLEKDINAPSGTGKTIKWICRCDCGITRSVCGVGLRTGSSKSCGCLTKEVATKHGMRHSREYQSWLSMRARVKPTYHQKDLYFDRGIDIDPEWDKSFEAFFADMGAMPEDMNSIDRIDNNLGYWKSNCRWANDLMQGQNRRNVIMIEYQGKRQSLREWSKETGISAIALKHRFDRGWSVHDMLTKPYKPTPKLEKVALEMKGKKQSLSDWAVETGIPYSVLKKRLKRGWSPIEVLTMPLGAKLKLKGEYR